MRKKSHRGLNRDDRSFDKFYLINYLEMGKRWTQLGKDNEGMNLTLGDIEMIAQGYSVLRMLLIG